MRDDASIPLQQEARISAWSGGLASERRLAGSAGRCRCKRLKIKTIMTSVSKLDKVALNLYTPQHVPGPKRQDQAELSLREASDCKGGATANGLRRLRGYEQDHWN